MTSVITTTNKGSTTYRNDPDVAAEANFDNPTASNGSFETGFGGTSFAAPRWAGFIALVNQQSVANGHGTVGFVNPALYNLGVAGGTPAISMMSPVAATSQRLAAALASMRPQVTIWSPVGAAPTAQRWSTPWLAVRPPLPTSPCRLRPAA